MKKLSIYHLFILMLLPLLGACSKDEIVFDSELPRFETRPGYQLIEAIVPQETSPNDKIYIIGDFNGGMDAVGDPRWELQKATDTDVKWGIYLDPKDFVEGKTLADGYTFYNVEQGVERALGNKDAIHTDAPSVGGRLNVLIYFWADYYNKPSNPDEIIHDGYAIYVVDNTGYDELTMYAWGDAEAFGGWPGIRPTGKVEKNGVVYKYFDTGAANEGLNLNLIFNNNGAGKQLPDYNVTLNQDFYLELTPDGVNEFDPDSAVKHDGYAVFVVDRSGWNELYLYMWGTVDNLNGGWPGMAPTGTQVINGVTYKYFDLGAANCDGSLEEHVILNDGNGKQVDDVVVFNLDRDVYVELTSTGATEIDPNTYVPGSGETPGPTPAKEYKIYIEDKTGWSDFYVYAWGDKEIFGAWPGVAPTETETIGGVAYKVLTVEGNGETENLIFNDNNGTQYDAMQITVDRDYTIIANPDSATLK